MSQISGGLGGLVRRPQYVYEGSRYQRYGARFYRPIIFILTSTIVLVTLWRYRSESFSITAGFFIALVLYLLTYFWRMSMNPARRKWFYQSGVQLMRGQLTLLGVTVMIGLLAANGVRDHNLWILYVLATLIVSEHNRTEFVVLALIEVAFVYTAISYLGMLIHHGLTQGNWQIYEPGQFLAAHPNILLQILGIWLITFVFHYLVQNIHGRDLAFAQQRQWLNLVAEQWVSSEESVDQRRALLNRVEEIIQARAKLWLPGINGRTLTDTQNNTADGMVEAAIGQRQLLYSHEGLLKVQEDGRLQAILRRLRRTLSRLMQSLSPSAPEVDGRAAYLCPLANGWGARIVLPIFRLDEPGELVGVLDLVYDQPAPHDFELERDIDRLEVLAGHARLLLISSYRREQLHQEKELARRLNRHLSVQHVIDQVVNDITGKLGFDCATVSLVDLNEELIRCKAGKNAPWAEESIHTLHCGDVQSRVVREGRIYRNKGKYRKYLDKRIWHKYGHRELVRIWVPILAPAPDSFPYPALGTIEAGFHRSHQPTIAADLARLLERYANYVAVALSNAQMHERKRELADALTALEQISREIQEAAAFYEPHQMIRLIGNTAEELLQADIVMLYTLSDEGDLELPYVTEHAIKGKGDLSMNLDHGVLANLNQRRESYYASDARRDSILVNLKPCGGLDLEQRTFTQRQNIKSFAGIPLIGKSGTIRGFLCINYRRRHQFYEEECQIIEMFAELATVALEETYNHRLARTLAISGERDNLAAELHHALSQNLYGLRQYTNTALFYSERNDVERATQNLQKIAQIADGSLSALDELLRNLREKPGPIVNFVEELLAHIQSLERVYSACAIHFEYQVDGFVQKQAQFYLMRIAREAVNNALRHARAKNIHIRYQVEASDVVTLCVQDDGQGFDVAKARRTGRYGLSAIDYYAHKLNTQVDIESKSEQGSCLSVQVMPPGRRARL